MPALYIVNTTTLDKDITKSQISPHTATNKTQHSQKLPQIRAVGWSLAFALAFGFALAVAGGGGATSRPGFFELQRVQDAHVTVLSTLGHLIG